MTVAHALGLSGTERVCIIGCGGKTSLMLHLADVFRPKRVLLTTTTHIRRPDDAYCDRFFDADIHEVTPLSPGISVLGRVEHHTGKLSAVPPDKLKTWAAQADLVLIEGDGSRGLPLKGWNSDDPVVPEWTTVTVGVVTVWSVGMPATEDIVFRLPVFCRLTGAEAEKPVTVDHIAAMVASKDGLFKNAVGRRILFINQIESPASHQQATQLAAKLSAAPLDMIISGSIQNDSAHILHRSV